MELIETLPKFNLYEDFWKIYTNNESQLPQYTGPNAVVKKSIISEGCRILGTVEHSVIGTSVIIEEGAVVRDSIIMENCIIRKGCVLDRCIIDQNTEIGENVTMGVGENIANEEKPKIYNTGITVIGSNTVVPSNLTIGKNCVIYGTPTAENFVDNKLESGKTVIVKKEAIL
jgi:glucose-1-phosphate adenylyltransferase